LHSLSAGLEFLL